MQHRHSKADKFILTLLFCIVLGGILIANSRFLLNVLKTETLSIFSDKQQYEPLLPEEIEQELNEKFCGRLHFIDINGLAAKIMGQKLLNGTVKGTNGQLDLVENFDYEFFAKNEAKSVSDAIAILDFAQAKKADILYVQRPWKNSDSEKGQLPYGLQSDYGKQFDVWCDEMKNCDIPVLDLRKSIKKHLLFYDTDHHWTIESSFYAAKSIAEKLNQEYGLGFDTNRWFDINQYAHINYPNSFLGSQGIRTGKYYAGKDDFSLFVPAYNTDFIYQHYVGEKLELEKSGDWWNAFIDEKILEDKNYYNKYNACLNGGYVENIITNSKSNNQKKLLLVSDSFARPMVMYLSLLFSETRYLDPQEGRYNGSYIDYIDRYQPDVVIMMYTGKFQTR